MAKNKQNPRETTVQNIKSREQQRIPLPISLALGIIVGWLVYRVVCVLLYVNTNPDVELSELIQPLEILCGSKIPLVLDFTALMGAALGFFMVIMYIEIMNSTRKKTRNNAEQGSARWCQPGDTLPFQDPNYLNNTIFTETELISCNEKISGRNRNIVLLGRPGTGKSFRFYKPNLLQKYDSTVLITDPKGELLRDCGYAMKEAGYDIKVLNLDDLTKSNHFNIFRYIPFTKKFDPSVRKTDLTEDELRSGEWMPDDTFVDQLISAIMLNSGGEGGGSEDPFWDNTTKLLYKACFFLVLCTGKKTDQTLWQIYDLIAKAAKKDGGESLKEMFDEWKYGAKVIGKTGRPVTENSPFWIQLEEDQKKEYIIDPNGLIRRKSWVNKFGVTITPDPTNPGVQAWDGLSAGGDSEKTMASIYLSALSKIEVVSGPQLAEVLSADDMDLTRIGMEESLDEEGKVKPHTGGRIAYFVCTAPSKPAYNFVAALFFTIGFQILDQNAKSHPDGRCPKCVDFYLDELANIGKIPRLIEMMAYVRGLNCGIVIGLQSLSQLKELYKESWETALDCCDSILFLGSSSKETLEYISSLLGKESIDLSSSSKSYGKSGSTSNSTQVSARSLLDPDEVKNLPDGYCLYLDAKSRTGTGYLSPLYQTMEHPRASLLYNPRAMGNSENDEKLYRHELYLYRGDMGKYEKAYSDFFDNIGLGDDVEVNLLNIQLPFGDSYELNPEVWFSGEELLNYVNMVND